MVRARDRDKACVRQQFDQVHLTAQGRIAVIALNHPQTVNALSAAMMRGLNAALDAVEVGDFPALILTDEARAFCSGANITKLPERQAEGAGETLERLYHSALRRLRNLKIPIVTAVNGATVGIGMSFALMVDLIVAARSAYFLLSFSRIGLVPDGGATWLLPRLIGLARARELALLAEKLPAEQALGLGLINRVVDDARLMEEEFTLAQRLADGPAALALTRRLFWDSPENNYEAQLAAERTAQNLASQTEDFREGLAAFQKKCLPRFSQK